MAAWTYDFEGNQLDRRFIRTRLSAGGQNNGVWSSDISSSKLYWKGTAQGTESDYWGEKISLPVNAPGDIEVDASIRIKKGAGTAGLFGIGFNQNATLIRYGCELNVGALGIYLVGRNNTAQTALPGMPSKTSIGPLTTDVVSSLRVVRKNNYIFLYMDGRLIGQYAYATAITSVDLTALCYIAQFGHEYFCEWIRVSPSSVVGP